MNDLERSALQNLIMRLKRSISDYTLDEILAEREQAASAIENLMARCIKPEQAGTEG